MLLTKTIDGFLDVPAGAEYVLEGELQPRVRVPEGPFGEFPGSYSGARRQVVIKVKRVTHRRDPSSRTSIWVAPGRRSIRSWP